MITEESKCVLVVEDDPRVLDALRDGIELLGYCILTASNGQEGLAQFVANSSSVSVLMVDAQMPVMNGWELLASVRQFDKQVPIIFSSGSADVSRMREAQAVDDKLYFLQKPYSLGELKAMLQHVLAG